MIRSGANLTAGLITANGGSGGDVNSTSDGGAGADGRVRWDAPTGAPPPANVATHRGQSFAESTPLVARMPDVTFSVMGKPAASFTFYTVHGGSEHTGGTETFDGGGAAQFTALLRQGHNKVCVTLSGGTRGSNEADKCIDVAFLP
jgi:hypothetical protein